MPPALALGAGAVLLGVLLSCSKLDEPVTGAARGELTSGPTDTLTVVETGIADLERDLSVVADPEERCRLRAARMQTLTAAVIDVAPGREPPREEIGRLRELILLSPEAQADTDAVLTARVAAGAHYEPTAADRAVADEFARTHRAIRGAR